MKRQLPYALLYIALLGSCAKHYQRQKEDFNHYSLKEQNENGPVGTVVAGYKTKVTAETERVIATTQEVITRNKEQSPLGNFVCDAMKHASDSIFKSPAADLVIVNRRGLRIDLPKGDIKTGTIFELMPFDNELVLISVPGEKLMAFLPLFRQEKHPFLGATITLERDSVSGFLINGQPVDGQKTYRVLTSDYLANGGDNFKFLQDPLALQTSGFKIRDAIINYCLFLTQQGKQIIPYTDERLKISK